MYKEHFGLKELPFSIAPDPRYLYMSEGHREALAHLLYGIASDGGFVLLTGEVGTGKTTACRCLLEQLPNNVDVAFIIHPTLTVEELLAAICDDLGINYPKSARGIKVFVDAINVYLLDSHAKGRKTILIIEEAQNLASDVLEQVRLLTNLETNERKLLQIIMIGQPELREKLARAELRQLTQRITARCHLGPLAKKDIPTYINHRLQIAGARSGLFSAAAMNKVQRLSGGIPRLINILCDRALLGACVEEQDRVDVAIVNKAAREVFGRHRMNRQHKRIRQWAVAAVALLLLGTVFAVVAVNTMDHKVRNIPNTAGTPMVQRHDDTLWWFSGKSPGWRPPERTNWARHTAGIKIPDTKGPLSDPKVTFAVIPSPPEKKLTEINGHESRSGRPSNSKPEDQSKQEKP